MWRASVLSFHDIVHVQLHHKKLLSNTASERCCEDRKLSFRWSSPWKRFREKRISIEVSRSAYYINALSFYNWRASPNIVFGIGRLYLERIHGATIYLSVRALLLCAPRSRERQKPVGEMQSASHWLLLQAGRWSFRTETFTFWLSLLWSRALTSPQRSSTDIV